MVIDNIWLAESKRFHTTFKSLVYDDKGSVELKNGSLIFNGGKGIKQIENIKGINLVRSQFNIGNFIMAFIVTVFYGLFIRHSYIFTIVLLAIQFSIFYLLWIKQKWIEIQYENASSIETIYISDSSGLGWKGMFGGTESLFEKMNSLNN
jgi:hypothetical protein